MILDRPGTHNFVVVAQNGFAESMRSRLRDEFLSQEVFLSLADARVRVGIWRQWYNEERPHSSLGYLMPGEFARNHARGAQVHSAETADEQ